jgi:hypothetical protein
MSENPRDIKVVDRRLFTADGEIREEAAAAMAEAGSVPESAPAVPEVPPEPVVQTDPAFLRLLDILAQTASYSLQEFADPATGRRQVDLAGARQIIDSLVSLREKTRGRLSFEETDAFEGLASELQLVYSRFAAQSVPKGPATPPAARRG